MHIQISMVVLVFTFSYFLLFRIRLKFKQHIHEIRVGTVAFILFKKLKYLAFTATATNKFK